MKRRLLHVLLLGLAWTGQAAAEPKTGPSASVERRTPPVQPDPVRAAVTRVRARLIPAAVAKLPLVVQQLGVRVLPTGKSWQAFAEELVSQQIPDLPKGEATRVAVVALADAGDRADVELQRLTAAADAWAQARRIQQGCRAAAAKRGITLASPDAGAPRTGAAAPVLLGCEGVLRDADLKLRAEQSNDPAIQAQATSADEAKSSAQDRRTALRDALRRQMEQLAELRATNL
jgi:hypothetical protein